MLTEQYIILLAGRKDFRESVELARQRLGIPRDVSSIKAFNKWNNHPSNKIKEILITEGTVFEGDVKKLSRLSIEDNKIKKKDLDDTFQNLSKDFDLPKESIKEIEYFIVSNKLCPTINLDRNYEAYLTQKKNSWSLYLEITPNTRRRDIEWKKSVKMLQKLLKSLPNKNTVKGRYLTHKLENSIILELSEFCRQEDINWLEDVVPKLKSLPGYTGNKRPIDLEDYKLLQKREMNNLRLRNIAYEKVGFGENSGNKARAEQKRLKSKQTRYKKRFE